MSHTTWPTASDVVNALAGAGVTLRAQAAAQVGDRLGAVVAYLEKETLRQFVADATASARSFHGSGTGLLDVDEFVELGRVDLVGYVPGYPLIHFNSAYAVQENRRPLTQIGIRQGVMVSNPSLYLTAFPEGRSNIQVTARWGYASTLPDDVWDAVLYETAFRMLGPGLFDPAGRTTRFTDGDTSIAKEMYDPDTTLGWHRQFQAAIARYRRPAGKRLRNWKPRLI